MSLLKFKPILKETLWGGGKLPKIKHIEATSDQIGESWDISGFPGMQTEVSEGPYAGTPLNTLVSELKDKLVGKKVYERYGNEFPLLIKFIDASKNLSIQVHPNDEVAQRQGHKRGKTDMWYVLPSDDNAHLLCGLNRAITPEEYRQRVADDSITDVIGNYKVQEGDCFFIPAGRIHSIGAGCLLTEIQQTNDLTYRIYDFKRKDKNGNYRQLHTKEAAESIDYKPEADCRTHYTPAKDRRVELVNCPYFTTSVYDITHEQSIDTSRLDSFVILIGVGGTATVTDNEGNSAELPCGTSLLVPASATSITLKGKAKVLEVHIAD